MTEIDRRKNYYLTIDTETANSLDDALVYDIGGAIHDKKGRVYETFSFVIYEVFVGMKDLMQAAYFANKIPKYEDDLLAGTRKMVQYLTAEKHIKHLCEKYNVRAIIAHNAIFDYRATNTTQRYLTCSKYRYFLPYGIEVWDTLKMVKSTVAKQKSYLRWCEENGFMVNANRPRMTAEILYKYITGNVEYKESHTGLEDVLIEKQIFVWCMRQHKKMDKKLFE
jgi:hypothetical protein